MTPRLTVLPFLVAVLIGMAHMGTDIYKVCAWQVGIAKLEPWRRTSSTLARISAAVTSRWRRLFDALGGWRTLAAASATLVMLAMTGPDEQTSFVAMAAVGAGIKEIRAERAQVHKDFEAALADVRKAETPDAKKTARERATTLQAKFDDLGEDLKLEERKLEQERQLGAAIAAGQAPQDLSQATAEAVARQNGVSNLRDRAADDPKHGFKDHREFLQTVMDAGLGRKVDARLMPLRATQGSDEQGAYSDPHGGFLVPHGIAPGILSIQPEDDPVAALTTKPPMRTPTVSFNARTDKDHTSSVSGGLVVTRRPETVDGSSSRMKFEQVTLTANELFGLAFATERILTDSPESFVAILAAGFRDEYAAKSIDERLNGTGVGEPLGVLHANNACLISVSKEGGQAADTIVKENIDKMVSRSWRYGRAVWLANHDTLPQLLSIVQVVGTGGSAVPYLTGTPGGPMMLLNRPIYFTEFAKKLGDKGDLLLGVWSEYLEGEYQPLRSDESIHVRFAAAERCFRFYKRNDGQPWWRAALTPRYSTQTLSPFVTLEAR